MIAAGSVDQYVDRSEVVFDGECRRLKLLFFEDVASIALRNASVGNDLGSDRFGFFAVQIDSRDFRACLCERFADGGTQNAATAGYDGDFSGKV